MNAVSIAVFATMWVVVIGFLFFVAQEEANDRRRDARFIRQLDAQRARFARLYGPRR